MATEKEKKAEELARLMTEKMRPNVEQRRQMHEAYSQLSWEQVATMFADNWTNTERNLLPEFVGHLGLKDGAVMTQALNCIGMCYALDVWEGVIIERVLADPEGSRNLLEVIKAGKREPLGMDRFDE